MKPVKDNFSALATIYAKFRPVYPAALYEFLRNHTPAFSHAWDCGTGNGQVAVELSRFFEQVTATDISQAQLDAAQQQSNISYIACRAEQTGFADNSFDLITIAQAIHWFDFDRFYAEAIRVARPGALLAAWTYTLCRIDAATDRIIDHLYQDIAGPYWDKERSYVDDEYRTIPFPFTAIDTPVFFIEEQWNLPQMTGYLGSWSAIAHYRQQNGTDPLQRITGELEKVWPADTVKTVRFPVYMRAGHIQK